MADLSGISSTGLELLLEFDNNTDDSSANNRDQTPEVGALTYASDGAVGQAAKFRYSSQNHIDTGANALGSADLFCDSGSSDFTVATFIRFSGDSAFGTGTICARQEGTGAAGIATSNFFLHVLSDRRLLVRLRGQDNIYSVQMHDGSWHSIAVTWDGSAAAVYFDGVALTAPTVGNVAENTVNIFIGGSSLPDINGLPTSNLVGQLDDFRVYSRAWTAGEAYQHYLYGPGAGDDDSSGTQPSNLELHLKFEGNLLDSSVNARHQTNNLTTSGAGALTYSTDRQVDDQSSVWAGGEGEIHIDTGVTDLGAASLFADTGEAWSVSFWTRDTGGDGGVAIAKGDVFGGTHVFAVWVDFDAVGSPETKIYIRDSLKDTYLQADLDDGEWHHHVITWDGSDAAYYYDGAAQSAPSVGSNAEQGNIIIGAVRDTNGANPDFTVNYAGGLDDLRVYSRALSSDDVDDLFALAPGKYAATLTITSIADEVASLQVVFGASVTGFAAGDVTVTNGSVSNVAGSGTTYTFDVTATADGVVTAKVNADAVADANGVGNAASSTLSWGVSSVASPSGTGLLRFDRTVAPTHTASVLIGPIPISENSLVRSIIQRARVILGSGTDATGSFLISCGVDAEDAVTRAEDDGHQYSTTIAAVENNAGLVIPRIAGHAAVFQIDVTSGHLTLEGIDVQLEQKGRNRAGRYVP